MAAIDTSRQTTGIALPYEISSEIWSKTQEDSAVMQLARRINLPGAGLEFQTITGDPSASWVDETGIKPSVKHEYGSKKMKGYTLALIEPFSNQFKRDKNALYNEVVNRMPGILAKKFDETVFAVTGTTAPGENFDTLASCPTASVGSSSIWDTLVTADHTIATNDGLLNGWAITPTGKSKLLTAKDTTGRPLFIDSMTADSNVASIMGHPAYVRKGISDTGVLGYAGDWSSAVYGIVEDIKMDVAEQASITNGSEVINLFERNMFAIRFEMEVGFVVKDANHFVKITE
jgi:HK97 family phage major capsid protein